MTPAAADNDAPWHPATVAVHAGRPPGTPGQPVNPPVVFSSTYHADGPVDYGRAGNPTWSAFEEAIGRLENGNALVFGSGMAAASAILDLLPTGARVVVPSAAYSGTIALAEGLMTRGHLEVAWVDITDTAAVSAALDGAQLLWIESPTNPLLDVVALPPLLAAARDRGVITVVDNTFATPLLQRPLDDGADLVIHSATKLLSGHSDVILGVVVVSPDSAHGPEHTEQLSRIRRARGAIAGPMEVWLALRGLRTLDVRLERACASAAELAGRLTDHPGVARVRYPGFGAMISIDVRGDAAVAEEVAHSTNLWIHATSLGGVESQVERRRRHPLEPETVPEQLLRLSVGIENVEDLWTDLDQAIARAVRA